MRPESGRYLVRSRSKPEIAGQLESGCPAILAGLADLHCWTTPVPGGHAARTRGPAMLLNGKLLRRYLRGAAPDVDVLPRLLLQPGVCAATSQPIRMDAEREKVWFASGGTECAGWHYAGSHGGCVITAAGFAVTKEPATDLFARRFHDAGFSALAFDYRGIGQSGGQPRQVQRIRDQLADWQAAITFAAALPEAGPVRLAIWSFSASGGQVFQVAARDRRLAAALAQTPTADSLAAARNAALYQTPRAVLRTVPGTPKRLSLGHPADCRSPADRALCPGGFSLALLLRWGTVMSCCPGSRSNSDSASARSVPQRRRPRRRQAPLPASGPKLRPRAARRPSRPVPW
jgi:hypothetical protein